MNTLAINWGAAVSSSRFYYFKTFVFSKLLRVVGDDTAALRFIQRRRLS